MRLFRGLLCWVACAFVVAWTVAPAGAQTYPDRPIKIIVPIGPGGSYDIVGRLLADHLSKRLGPGVTVENRTGAGTVIGTQSAIASPPDGYTFVVGGLSNVVFNSSLYKTAPYDGLAELVPVALVYQFSYMLMASKSMPYASAKELIEAAKGKPDSLSVANAGVGTGQHLAAVAFQKFTGTKFVEVPYRGSALVYPDLLSGRVDLFFDSTAAALPYIKTGQVRGIATLTSKRDKQAPDMPTMTEAGVPGLEIESWIGLFAPAKTPPAAIERLQKEIAAIIPDMKERFETIGGDVMVMPPEKLKEFVRSEHDKWTRIIKDAGIVLD